MQEETEKITFSGFSSQVVALLQCPYGGFDKEFFEAGRHVLSLNLLKFVLLTYQTTHLWICDCSYINMDFFTFLFIVTLLSFVLLFILIFLSDGDLTLMFKEKIGTRLSKLIGPNEFLFI